nr:CAP domain-containing protein [Roseibium aquae]
MPSFRFPRLVWLLACVLAVASCAADQDITPPFYQSMARVDAEVDAATAAQMISHYRSNNGLPPVTADPVLSRLAREQAVAMARAGTVRTSLASERQLNRRMAEIGQANVPAVENVSAGYHTIAEAFSGWRESPQHNKVMLNAEATRLGIATAYAPGSKHRVFWALIMAGPAAPVQ